MKKLYEELTLEIIRFGALDIITASDAAEDDDKAETTNDDTDTKDDTTGSDETPWTSGVFNKGDGEENTKHQLTPAGTSENGNPLYTDENGTTWEYDAAYDVYVIPAT